MDSSKSDQPLYLHKPTERFTDRAQGYALYRPTYPEAAIARIVAGLDPSRSLMAADIGAGTGISSRLLAAQGLHVQAIEPNAAMIAAAAPHPQVSFHQAPAEATGLASASVDLVTSFQAFHWFDPRQALAEFHRILKPQGRLALVWNNRDRQDDFTQFYSELVRQASHNHPAQEDKGVVGLEAYPQFQHWHHYQFPYRQRLDLEGLWGRATSVSYIPHSGPVYQQLLKDLEQLYQQFCDQQGWVYLSYCTDVHLAQPVT